MGPLGRISGLYKAIVTMLVESSALLRFEFVVVHWIVCYHAVDIFLPILAEVQVRAFLPLRISGQCGLI